MIIDDVSYNEFKYIQRQSLSVQPYIKNYNDKYYKMVVLKAVIDYSNRVFTKKGFGENENKLLNNLIRAKNRVFEIAVCNDFDYFVTLTLDKTKYDRYNLKKYIKDLSQYIRNTNKKYNCNIKYVFVPEQHLDGAWHLHGLIKNLPCEQIQPTGYFDKNGDSYLHWVGYAEKFGYMSMSKINDDLKCSFYIRKYITKTMAENNFDLGVHTYYCSQGLKRANENIYLSNSVLFDVPIVNFSSATDFVDVYSLDKKKAEEYINLYGFESV